MDFNFGLQSVSLLFFFVQGLVFSFLLLRKGLEQSNNAGKWLSLFLFTCCLYIAPWMFGHAGWYAQDGYREVLFFIPFQQLFLIGPVIYFYTQSLLQPTFRFEKKDWLHFFPAGLYLLYSLVIFLTDQFLLAAYFFYADGRDRDLDTWYQIIGFISMIIYVVLSIQTYDRYRKRIFQELSYADSVIYKWVKRFLLALLIILVLRLFFLVLSPNFGDFGVKYWYYLLFSCLFYYIAIAGYTNTIKAGMPVTQIILPEPPEKKDPEDSIEESKETEKVISNIVLKEWTTKVQHLMDSEKFYQNPTLTLTDLAKRLDTTSKQVSTVINQGFQMNFNDFVNQYRIEAVKKRFERGDTTQFTILSIALECGFNSKTTFNRVFKKYTSVTPVQYLSKSKKKQ